MYVISYVCVYINKHIYVYIVCIFNLFIIDVDL